MSKASYGLAAAVGAAPYDTELYSVVDYEAGTGSIPTGEGAALVYDPATGGLWRDTNRGDNTSGASAIAVIANHASYSYDIDDFTVDD